MTYKGYSNIALLKYMGRLDHAQKIPCNPSLSLTLSDFFAEINVERLQEKLDGEIAGTPIKIQSILPLSTKDRNRLERFVEFLYREAPRFFELQGLAKGSALMDPEHGTLLITLAVSFPVAAGIASSAAVFSGLTVAVFDSLCAIPGSIFQKCSATQIASFSRMGSGSSCRSFLGPWVKWDRDQIQGVATKAPEIVDLVAIIDANPKAVSSSEAHLRVQTSPLFESRQKNINDRLKRTTEALETWDPWELGILAREEFLEMHRLFETADPPFMYRLSKGDELIEYLLRFQKRGVEKSPPVVTMDAGPNVHVLVEKNQTSYYKKSIQEKFPGLTLLESSAGTGIFSV